jgi:STE24 endopeptidase
VPDLARTTVDERTLFDPQHLERAGDYRTGTRALWAVGEAVRLSVLLLLAWRAPGLARRAVAALGGERRAAAAVAVLASVAVWSAVLPVGAVRHWWSRRHGLSEQGYAAWLGDAALELLVTTVLVAIAVTLVVVLARRLGSRWWIAGGPALALAALVFMLVQPVVVQPLFNRYQPLADAALARDVRALADGLGVDLDGVDVSDASRRTAVPNASVVGIGPGRRVVIDDTLLASDRFARREVLVVAAHELGHVARSHVWKGVAWFALIALPAAWLVAFALARRFARGAADPAAVPLGLLLATVAFLVTLPLQNAVSRRYEAEADWLALRATDDPAALERLVVGLSSESLGDPTPPGWTVVLLGTHPSTVERVAMARLYAAR